MGTIEPLKTDEYLLDTSIEFLLKEYDNSTARLLTACYMLAISKAYDRGLISEDVCTALIDERDRLFDTWCLEKMMDGGESR